MRMVFATFGTFGDVNPLMGLGAELQRRGHSVVLAAPEMFRRQAAGAGLGFTPVRPDQDPDNAALAAMIYDRKRGTERGLREFLFPALRASYDDLLAAVQTEGGPEGSTDLLLSSELAYAAPMVAEVTGVRWASYVLAPFSFFSAYDPPVLPPYPKLSRLLADIPFAGHLLRPFARAVTRSWCKPVDVLRNELGLGEGGSPLFEGKHAPGLVLALFSELLGAPQPDWPPQTRQCGFIFYDRNAAHATLAPELETFLHAGSPPVVFTLGSAAVLDPGEFFRQSAQAALRLGQRAVLLTGRHTSEFEDKDSVCCAEYAPYSLLFPRAAAIVHQGGVGTTAQALLAGKPMLVMPYSHDQLDNARRAQRLGVARVLPREDYTAARAADEFKQLFADPEYADTAEACDERMRREDGLAAACNALEEFALNKAL
jgi:rhamnosyltransferase subunit B